MGIGTYYFYSLLVNLGLIAQMILSSVFIILGALPTTSPGRSNLAIAILGSLNGIVTGGLSIVKGQGKPMRLLKYAEGLLRVRQNIEFAERQLRAGFNTITLGDVFDLRDSYEQVRLDVFKNNPDHGQWSSDGWFRGGQALPFGTGQAHAQARGLAAPGGSAVGPSSSLGVFSAQGATGLGAGRRRPVQGRAHTAAN